MSTPSLAFKGQDETTEVGECRCWGGGGQPDRGTPQEKQTPATTEMTDELQSLCFLHPGAEMTTSHLQPTRKHHQSRTASCPLPGDVLGWAPLASCSEKTECSRFCFLSKSMEKKRSRRHSRSGSCSTALSPVLVMALAASLPRAKACTEAEGKRSPPSLAHRATALPPTRPHPPGITGSETRMTWLVKNGA